MDHAVIYDKMRLFLQREHRCQEAVKFGIFSHLIWAIGLDRQARRQELRSHMAKNAIRIMLLELLRKAKTEDSIAEIQQIVDDHVKSFPNINFPLLGRQINSIALQ